MCGRMHRREGFGVSAESVRPRRPTEPVRVSLQGRGALVSVPGASQGGGDKHGGETGPRAEKLRPEDAVCPASFSLL